MLTEASGPVGLALLVAGLGLGAGVLLGAVLGMSRTQRAFRQGWRPHEADRQGTAADRRYRSLDRRQNRVVLVGLVVLGVALLALAAAQVAVLARSGEPLAVVAGLVSLGTGLLVVVVLWRAVTSWTQVDGEGITTRELFGRTTVRWSEVTGLEENTAQSHVTRARVRSSRPVMLPGVSREDLPDLVAHAPHLGGEQTGGQRTVD